jgi:hypothetical protein
MRGECKQEQSLSYYVPKWRIVIAYFFNLRDWAAVIIFCIDPRRVWRYQRGNQNPYIEEQTTQWPKEKSTKGQTTIYKTYI